MSFWLREIAGWLLVLVGLAVFAFTLYLCALRAITVAPITMIVGIFIFRGGIHLLKVAIAARIAGQAQERLYPLPGANQKR